VHKAIGGSYLFPSRFSCCAVSKYLTCSESFIFALPDVKFAHNVFASANRRLPHQLTALQFISTIGQ
jgi:hypothetical protein